MRVQNGLIAAVLYKGLAIRSMRVYTAYISRLVLFYSKYAIGFQFAWL